MLKSPVSTQEAGARIFRPRGAVQDGQRQPGRQARQGGAPQLAQAVQETQALVTRGSGEC